MLRDVMELAKSPAIPIRTYVAFSETLTQKGRGEFFLSVSPYYTDRV